MRYVTYYVTVTFNTTEKCFPEELSLFVYYLFVHHLAMVQPSVPTERGGGDAFLLVFLICRAHGLAFRFLHQILPNTMRRTSSAMGTHFT